MTGIRRRTDGRTRRTVAVTTVGIVAVISGPGSRIRRVRGRVRNVLGRGVAERAASRPCDRAGMGRASSGSSRCRVARPRVSGAGGWPTEPRHEKSRRVRRLSCRSMRWVLDHPSIRPEVGSVAVESGHRCGGDGLREIRDGSRIHRRLLPVERRPGAGRLPARYVWGRSPTRTCSRPVPNRARTAPRVVLATPGLDRSDTGRSDVRTSIASRGEDTGSTR